MLCGVCDNCCEIEQGCFVDLIEIDVVLCIKVEDICDLLDNVQYVLVCGCFKVYLIDEVYMLLCYSFNVLLKIFEELLEYVKFLLVMIDLQKLLVMILLCCL